MAESNLTNFGNLVEILWHRAQARYQEFFVAGEVSWNRDSSMNVLCMEYNRKAPQGEKKGVFCPRYSQYCILNENLTYRCTQTGYLFSKIRALFCKIRVLFLCFQKRAGETSPHELCIWNGRRE